jgi:probable HAF family extracellular repeat protein
VEQLETRWCPANYIPTDLGTIAGGADMLATAINNQSPPTIVGAGYVGTYGHYRAALWQDGTPQSMVDMNTIPAISGPGSGWELTWASGVNDGRQIVGSGTHNGASRAFRWTVGSAYPPDELHALAGGSTSEADAINNADVVVGAASTAAGATHAVVWQGSLDPIDLNTWLPANSGWVLSEGSAVNASQVAGTGVLNGQNRAFLYTDTDGDGLFSTGPGVVTDLGSFMSGGRSSAAGLNSAGKVVGTSEAAHHGVNSEGYQALLWTPKKPNGTSGTESSLGTLGGRFSEAYGINDSSQVVGRSTINLTDDSASMGVAFLWQQKGGMQNLNGLIPGYPGWILSSARAINNPAGQIVGYGAHNGQLVAFLLTPTSALTAAATASTPSTQTLTLDQAEPLLTEAIARWAAAGAETSSLHGVHVLVSDLPGNELGEARGRNTIVLDANAAGWGWFVDPTPRSDAEFTRPGNQGEQNRMDLLTVLEHELGHVLGYEHSATGVMQESLPAGTRRLPAAEEVGTAVVLGHQLAGRFRSASRGAADLTSALPALDGDFASRADWDAVAASLILDGRRKR